jgi:hypothetical protein
VSTTTNPFAILGLPERPDLDDETVRAAWRAIAVATHPDRADGGDLARYTQATAAFHELRTPWGRSEAYADLLDQARARGHPGDGGLELGTVIEGGEPSGVGVPAAFWPLLLAVSWIPSRIRHGRPVRLLIRAAIAAGLSLVVLALIPGQPAAPADIFALIIWFVLTGRKDLAPPPER